MVSRPSKKTTEWVETKATDEWLWVTHLEVDPAYQRELRPRKVQQIAREFDPDAIGVIYVSERDEGRYVILDGQTRVAAVISMGWTDQKVPCHVYHGLSLEDEARLFVQFNVPRTKPRPVDIFKARVTQGEPEATAIDAVLHRLRLHVGTGPAPHRVQAVGALDRVLKHAGVNTLVATLVTMQAAWGEHDNAYQGDVMVGIALVLARYPELNRKRLVAALTKAEPAVILAKARMLREVEGGDSLHKRQITGPTARVIVGMYNSGLRKRRLVWVDRNDRGFWSPITDTSADAE